jgi:pimeloyl-ACP methyl ester carboxylesterase
MLAMMLPMDEAGAGPCVVLLHAGIADRTMWSEHLPAIAQAGMRVIAMDLPGYGEAPVAAGLDAPWEDVLQSMDAAGVQSAAIVGCSFGGAIAQRIAAVAPDRVSALALISSPASGIEPSKRLLDAWEEEEDALEAGDTDAAVRAVLAAWLLPWCPGELRERVAAMQRRAFELQANAPPAQEAPDPLGGSLRALSAFDGRALVAVGEHDMPDFQQAADRLAMALGEIETTIVPGAGHLAPLEQPRAFRELLLGFLG